MSHVQAIFRRGVFEPLEPVDLQEEQRVRLSFEPAAEETPQAWLNEVRRLQAGVIERHGYLPDSVRDVAADRGR
ncbi:MAG: antitoxin family protein [Planctomycetes bacterium]|nr:antitoxin family protein [Planctomycetota bacterium]